MPVYYVEELGPLLRPWHIVTLSMDLKAANGRVCPAGSEFRFAYAMTDIAAGRSDIHGMSADGEPVVFVS